MLEERRTVDLGWGRVSYVTWTPDVARAAPTVVLLHGGGVDNALLSWELVADELAGRGYRVIAPDHPGYGESPAAPWVSTQERLVAYVGEFLDALGLDVVTLGGLSLGGGLALGFTLDHPDRVVGLMLFGSYGLAERMVTGPLARPVQWFTWASLRSGLLARATRSYGRSRRLMTNGLRGIVRNPAQLTPALVDAVMAEAGRPDALVAFGQWQHDQVGPGRLRTSYVGRLGEIGVPTLVVHGTHDSGVPVARAVEAAHRLPDATLLVVRDAGHWVQRDRPARVVPAVVEFLRRIPAR